MCSEIARLLEQSGNGPAALKEYERFAWISGSTHREIAEARRAVERLRSHNADSFTNLSA